MSKAELIRRAYNIITKSNYECFDELPISAKTYMNNFDEFHLKKVCIHHDFIKRVNIVSVRWIARRYNIPTSTAQNFYNKYKYRTIA